MKVICKGCGDILETNDPEFKIHFCRGYRRISK